MLKQQLKNSKKAKYEMGNFCEQYGLPLIAFSRHKRNKKHDKVHKDYNIKDIKNDLLNLMIFMLKRKMFIRKRIIKNLVKETVLIVENMVTLVKTANKNLVN